MSLPGIRAIGFLALGVLAAVAQAQQPWPARSVTYLVPLPPGGAMDVMARAVTRAAAERLGASIVVENRPGANFNIAANTCAKAKPDGYTFCMIPKDNILYFPHLEKLPYDPIKDLAPVTTLVNFDVAMTVHPSVPVANLRELAEYSKRNPNRLNYSGFGVASLATAEMTRQKFGVDMTYVPFKGAADAFQAFLAGDVQIIYVAIGYPGLIANVKSGKWKALGVPGETRNALLPDVPTFVESGLPAIAGYRTWQGVFAPAGTPGAVLTRMSAALSAVVRTPEFRDKVLTPSGFEPVGNTPEEFAALIERERKPGEEMARFAEPLLKRQAQ